MLGVVLMVVAAALNATASVLQRHATKDEPESAGFSLSLLTDLIRRPVWLLGIATMVAGFVLHGVAIALSHLSLVQPLLVVELPCTLLLASWYFGVRIPQRDWAAIGLQTVGLAAFVVCLRPVGGDPGGLPAEVWATAVACTSAVIGALVALGYRGRREHRAALLGIATGATFGLNSSLIAGVGASIGHGGGLFTTWQTYGVAVLGPLSFYLLQNALQAGNLVASQPGFTLVNPLVSVLWGWLVFGEVPRGGLFFAGTVLGGALVVLGTIVLARSALLDPSTSEYRPAEG